MSNSNPNHQVSYSKHQSDRLKLTTDIVNHDDWRMGTHLMERQEVKGVDIPL